MNKHHLVALLVYLASIVGVGLISAADQEAPSPGKADRYEVLLDSSVHMKGPKLDQKIAADTRMFYTWQTDGNQKQLIVDGISIKATMDGKQVMNAHMDRKKIINDQDGTKQVLEAANAPPALKEMLESSFGKPLCELTVDDDQRETQRKLVATPGARLMIENGMIANSLLFHPPFLRNADKWEAEVPLSIGNGNYATGELTYEKTTQVGDMQNVRISGTLINEGYQQENSPVEIQNATYKLEGEQTFDLKQQIWVTGKLDIKVSMDINADGNRVGNGQGKMVASFKHLPNR